MKTTGYDIESILTVLDELSSPEARFEHFVDPLALEHRDEVDFFDDSSMTDTGRRLLEGEVDYRILVHVVNVGWRMVEIRFEDGSCLMYGMSDREMREKGLHPPHSSDWDPHGSTRLSQLGAIDQMDSPSSLSALKISKILYHSSET